MAYYLWRNVGSHLWNHHHLHTYFLPHPHTPHLRTPHQMTYHPCWITKLISSDSPQMFGHCVILVMTPGISSIYRFSIHFKPLSNLSQSLLKYRDDSSIVGRADIHQQITTTTGNFKSPQYNNTTPLLVHCFHYQGCL